MTVVTNHCLKIGFFARSGLPTAGELTPGQAQSESHPLPGQHNRRRDARLRPIRGSGRKRRATLVGLAHLQNDLGTPPLFNSQSIPRRGLRPSPASAPRRNHNGLQFGLRRNEHGDEEARGQRLSRILRHQGDPARDRITIERREIGFAAASAAPPSGSPQLPITRSTSSHVIRRSAHYRFAFMSVRRHGRGRCRRRSPHPTGADSSRPAAPGRKLSGPAIQPRLAQPQRVRRGGRRARGPVAASGHAGATAPPQPSSHTATRSGAGDRPPAPPAAGQQFPRRLARSLRARRYTSWRWASRAQPMAHPICGAAPGAVKPPPPESAPARPIPSQRSAPRAPR